MFRVMASCTSKTPVVLFCIGCFNPVTNKHLRMLELARDALHRTGRYRVKQGVFSPAHDGYGKEGLLEAKHRVEMLRLAVKANPWLRVDTWETEQDNYTLTSPSMDSMNRRLDTVLCSEASEKASQEPSPKRKRKSDQCSVRKSSSAGQLENSVPRLMLVCGSDLLESFKVPGLWSQEHMENIVREYGIVVITRSGSDPHQMVYESDMLTKYSQNIHIVTDWIGDDFSSTKVRRAIRRNESVKYVVQDSVLDYIMDNKLYNPNYSPGDTDSSDTLVMEDQYRLDQSQISSGYFSMDNSLTLSPSTTTMTTSDNCQGVCPPISASKPGHLPVSRCANQENHGTTITASTILPPPKQFQRMNSQSMHNLSVPPSSKSSSQRSSIMSVCSRCRTTHCVVKSTSQDQQFKYICDNSCYNGGESLHASPDVSPTTSQPQMPLLKCSSYTAALQVVTGRSSIDVHSARPSVITTDTIVEESHREHRKCGCGLISAFLRHMPRCLKMKRNKKSSFPLVSSPSGL